MYRGRSVCVIVPAFNEAELIGSVLDSIPEYVDTVVVINDGSSDETPAIAKAKGALVVSHRRNRGVGAAFHTGVSRALELDPDIMVNIDADGQFDPRDIHKLIEPIIDKEADFVTASRFIDKRITPSMTKSKYWGNIVMSKLISLMTGEEFRDVSCGFRAYSREALLRLNLLGEFTYTQETFLDLAFKGLAIKEVPVAVQGVREHGRSRVAGNLFRYAYKTLKIILRAFRDHKPLRFFGFIAIVFVSIGFLLEFLLFFYYLQTGRFSPYKVVGITGGFLIGMGVIVFVTGLLADMFHRIRVNQEEILYYKKREMFASRDRRVNSLTE